MSHVTPYIYVIAAPELSPGRVKIGHTTNHPAHRLAQLQTGSPTLLQVVYYTEGNESTERILHAYFAGKRVHGEWFEFGNEDPVAAVTEAVALLREAVEPYDPDRRMTLPAIETGAQQRYEERRDAVIAALILNGSMGQRALASKTGIPEGTVRRTLDQMQRDGVGFRSEPDDVTGVRLVALNPSHPAVATMLP